MRQRSSATRPGSIVIAHCLCGTPKVLQQSEGRPRWLTDKATDYMWERNNMWMMFSAVATGTRDRTLLALCNGLGGTSHPVAQAAKWGFKPIELDARELLKS